MLQWHSVMSNKTKIKLFSWQAEDDKLCEQAMCNKFEKLGYSCTRYYYGPGTCFPTHMHAVDKIDGVLKGEFRLTMDGNSVVLAAGDYIFVPKGMAHSAEVIGDQAVVSIDAIKLS